MSKEKNSPCKKCPYCKDGWGCTYNAFGCYLDDIGDIEMNPEKKTKIIGYISTFLIYIGGPLVSLLPGSAIGWLFYLVASAFGMVYTLKKRDKAIFLQFAYYTFWNVLAIVTRMI